MPTYELTSGEIEAIATQVVDKLQNLINELFQAKNQESLITPDTYISTQEAADLIGISVRSLTTWCRKVSGIKIASRKNLLLPFTKVGKGYKFNRQLLTEGLQRGQFAKIPHQSMFSVA